jgi:hypothetical protein
MMHVQRYKGMVEGEKITKADFELLSVAGAR